MLKTRSRTSNSWNVTEKFIGSKLNWKVLELNWTVKATESGRFWIKLDDLLMKSSTVHLPTKIRRFQTQLDGPKVLKIGRHWKMDSSDSKNGTVFLIQTIRFTYDRNDHIGYYDRSLWPMVRPLECERDLSVTWAWALLRTAQFRLFSPLTWTWNISRAQDFVILVRPNP